MQFCPNCGRKLDDDATFCSECGFDIKNNKSPTIKSSDNEIEKLEYETLALDTKRIKATVDGVEVPLTKKEFEILKLLLENKGNVFSREEILSRIWKDEVYVLDRTIDVNITRLRKKIGPYGKNIVTRLGFGYCFEC